MKIVVLENYLSGGLTLREACEALGMHRTTFWRLVKKFRQRGPDGLRHGLQGRRSNRAKPESFKREICERFAREFKPRGASVHSFYQQVARTLPDYVCYATVLSWLNEAEAVLQTEEQRPVELRPNWQT